MGAKEVVVGDVRNSDDVARAMSGASAVFHVCPGGLAYWEREIGYSIIEAAQREGVQHLVLSTLMHPIITSLLQHQTKRDVEERLVSTPINWTILQPCDYMQTTIPPSTFKTGKLPMIHHGNTPHSRVDLRDVAEVAVKVLKEGAPHYWARYELCGLPQSLTGEELAALTSEVCGRVVEVQPLSGPEYMRLWAKEEGAPIGSAHGMDDAEGRAFAKRVLVNIEDWYSKHGYLGNPNVLTWLLGRAPRSMEEYLRDLYEGRC
jgi:uncharacterized protein YbjT (DUF2867 family)